MSNEGKQSMSLFAIPGSQPDELDRKVRSLFPGVTVRKDLVRRMRSAYSVPTFVIEFLLGRYCSDPDDEVVREGMEYVRQTLSLKYAKPDERELIKSRIEQQRRYELIEKVAVRLVEEDNQYWAELKNIDIKYVRIDSSEIRKHERLLTGGLWAEVEIEYDDSFQFKGKTRPFIIRELRPIQVSNLELDSLRENRTQFTTGEWLNFLIRSLGFREDHPYFTQRRKMLHVARLIPLVEKNYNLVELGPRGTGKSFVYQQVSPYSHLISGGQTTAAQMFVNLNTGQKGLVALWDTVAFDEMPRGGFEDKKVIDICKNYMEDGQFSRGREIIAAEGSVVFVGNLDGDIETILRTSHLFYPMPKQMDLAFFDRIHCYLPGWEFEKTGDAYYTSHLGLVSDFLAEVLTKLRKDSYTHRPEEFYHFGSHLSGRDQKAVRKTVSGFRQGPEGSSKDGFRSD
jgi:ATP-dependent Lon protease